MSILQQPFLLHETHEANLEKKWMVPMLVVDKREKEKSGCQPLSMLCNAAAVRPANLSCASTRRDFKLLSLHLQNYSAQCTRFS